MTRSSSDTMLVSTEHLRGASDRNVHLVRWANEPDHVESVVREAAGTLNHHLALLDGRAIDTEEDVLEALAEAFVFPAGIRARATSDWRRGVKAT